MTAGYTKGGSHNEHESTKVYAASTRARRRYARYAIGPSLADGIDEPFRAGYHEALNGKKVVFIPVAQAVDLAQGWFATMKKELEPSGYR